MKTGHLYLLLTIDPAALDAEERIYHNGQDVSYAADEHHRDLERAIGRVRPISLSSVTNAIYNLMIYDKFLAENGKR